MTFNLVAAFWQQETNTFNARKTELAAYHATAYLEGDAIVQTYRDTRTDWGAVFEMAEERDWTVISPLHAHAVPFGTLSQTAFESLAATILAPLTTDAPVDAVLLMLHGALVSEDYEDCEGELISRARRIVGPRVPIVVTLDPHGNVTQAMADAASAIVAYRTTPHVDQYETTRRALGVLCRIIDEKLSPRVHLARPPVLGGLDGGRTLTGQGPMVDALRRAAELEAENPDILAISLQAGYMYSDIAEAGPSATITTSGGGAIADSIGQELSRFIWDTRATRSVHLLGLDEALHAFEQIPAGTGPVVLVDYTDNPGGGANGDATALLGHMLRAGLKNAAFFSIADPAAVAIAQDAGIGARVTLALGGRVNPDKGGGPLHVSGVVRALSDGKYIRKGAYFRGTAASLGPSALLQIDGIDVIVCTYPNQTEERQQFQLFGIAFEQFDVVGCKGMNHFRVDLEEFSRALIFVDSGGICPLNPTKLPYQRLRRPIWPLDENITPELV
ncbi:M81 family metallopeptidase [Bosea sp. 2KB_26]|uniref:M81 family metallopeptidase n=1 Tax=Bosea sp. 2KB_26 TaxID=3237475 RepID=UPI003F9119BD